MKVWKMNGAGNAFAVFDARQQAFAPDTDKIRSIAAEMKADQVMAIEKDASSDAFLRIWNSSGEEVGACGNGTRAVAHLLLEEAGANTVSIRTAADLLKGRRAENGLVTVDMGQPRMGWEEIPLSEKMDVRGVDVRIGPMDNPYLSKPAVVSMGNPHAVFFVEDVDAYNIPQIGPLVEWHPLFPEGTNVGFAQVIDRETIRLRVWERGAGLTKACGTGACAALVCAARAGKTERKARMILDGGDLIIEWRESDNRVMMTGPVEVEMSFEL
ncbi:diaminopimelate epimerase [Henriciella algicola]|uniref:Diaminopimelate epimerase n=1 Tax=Henriciella algicola TaxID=1608422 RepID=A0A399RKS4_9PROT|nr:diaminopimelate epimerase [Henriciella algicola]RIJ31858.1 diaminopimelate epimerase [Henriciella algicola]